MLPNVLINHRRFPAPARIPIIICAPPCLLANIITIFLVVSGHHEQLGIGVGKLRDLDAVAVHRGVGSGIGRQGCWWTWRGIGLVLWRRTDYEYATCHYLVEMDGVGT